MHWSRGWSCTNHFADHVLITWLIMHWSHGWSCTDHAATMYWSHDWSCTDHVADHTRIMNQAVVQEGLALPTPQMHSWILLAHPCYTGEEAGVQGGWVIVTSHSHRPEDQRLNVPPLRPFYIWLLFTLGQIIRSLWLRFVLPASWTWTQTDLSKVGIYWLINCGVGEDSWESHGLQGDPTSPF